MWQGADADSPKALLESDLNIRAVDQKLITLPVAVRRFGV